jgi:hypothetical protein
MVEQFFTSLFVTCFLFYIVGLLSGYIIGYLKGKYLDKQMPSKPYYEAYPDIHPSPDHASWPEDEEIARDKEWNRRTNEILDSQSIPTGRIKPVTAQELRERKRPRKEREADKAMEESLKESGL